MKKIFSIIACALAISLSINAQDVRQRTVDTIVEDVLAQMPAQNAADQAKDMLDLANSAPESIVKLAAMLQSADKGANNRIEYAINGVTNFAATPGNQIYQTAVKAGLQKAIELCSDSTNKQFLNTQLRLLGKAENTGAAPAVDSKALLAEAKELMKSSVGADRCQALYNIEKATGSVDEKTLLKAVSDKDRKVRGTALRRYAPATAEFAAKLVKKYNANGEEGRADILNWLGDNKIASQLPFIISQVSNSGISAASAIEAAGKFADDSAADALISVLGGNNGAAALKALKSFPGKLNDKVSAAISSADGLKLDNLLELAGAKRMTNCTEQIFDLADKGNSSALKALKGVVTPENLSRLASMADKNNSSDAIDAFEAALKSLGQKERYQAVMNAINSVSNKGRFFNALAKSGTDEAVNYLAKAYENGSADALKALGFTNNYNAAPSLLKAGKSGDKEAFLQYIKYVSDFGGGIDNKCNAFCDALELTKDADIVKSILGNMASTPTAKAFTVASNFLDNKDAAYTAAGTVKAIASKCVDDIDKASKIAALEKVISILSSTGNADDSYAVSETKEIIAATKDVSPVFTLSDEEKKAGFEMLFDGTNIDKWTGNRDGYRISNNEIYVTAGYGDGGNLYTEKEYKDFVFRFEFSFVRPGANNGIGVRTPHGVDAAYGGMCEVQVLDHDDPIYANLNAYQVHGSVYGVIPAKRIVHKPLGEWSQEEIRVQGNHITVTVNGEVIVDGDIKEACQGHNVAPDGSDRNPYTVDHRNHPGMFNEKGFIGFLGHGPGVKFRNVRVLDLNAKTKKK